MRKIGIVHGNVCSTVLLLTSRFSYKAPILSLTILSSKSSKLAKRTRTMKGIIVTRPISISMAVDDYAI